MGAAYPRLSLALRRACLFFFTIALFVLAAQEIVRVKPALRQEKEQMVSALGNVAPLYLPASGYVRLVTLGFDHFFSNLLWFNTLSYFGEHFAGDKDYRWLAQRCELVASLEPQARHVYEFCTSLLAWVANQPGKSAEMLAQAIATEPAYWRYRYLRGFIYWYFLNRIDLAKQDLTEAAKLPDAPPFIASLASRMMVSEDDPETAIMFLRDLTTNTKDKNAKKALRGKLRRAIISRDTKGLEQSIRDFQNKFGKEPEKLSDLVSAGLLERIPMDPYGFEYALDEATGKVVSRSGKKGLEFYGRTAETGLAKE